MHKHPLKLKKSLILPIQKKTAVMRQRIIISLIAILLLGYSACKSREKCPAYGHKAATPAVTRPA